MDKEAARNTVLDRALPQIAFEGWTRTVLEQAAPAAGFTAADITRIFPGGAAQAVALFARRADAAALASYAALPVPPQKIRERIATLVRLRIQAYAPHREAVRRACAFHASPLHAAQGIAGLAHTVDALWHAAGDNSTDFNWYTKRLLLSGVYSTTLLTWLNDHSEGQAQSWAFLDRRIEDVMRIESAKKRLREWRFFPSP